MHVLNSAFLRYQAVQIVGPAHVVTRFLPFHFERYMALSALRSAFSSDAWLDSRGATPNEEV